MKKAVLRPEFVLTKDEVKQYNDLPDNLPDIKLTVKQKDFIHSLYYKYLSGKVVRGWGVELFQIEKGEKWPSGPRMKTHEAMRIILNQLVRSQDRKVMTPAKAADFFYSALSCRESYQILVNKIYELK